MKQLTEREAWKVIADAYGTEFSGRTEEQTTLADSGICDAITCLEEIDKIHSQYPMTDKVRECAPINKCRGLFFMPCRYHNGDRDYGVVFHDEFDHLRADFCMYMYYSLGGK